MRIRTVKPDFFLDEQLCARPPLERLLFQGLWCLADREGRLEDRPLKIKAQVLPYDECNVEEMLDNLGERFFILRYEVNERKYIQVRTFKKHQRPNMREAQSDLPAPPAFARARTRTHVQGEGEQEGEREGNNTPPIPPAAAGGRSNGTQPAGNGANRPALEKQLDEACAHVVAGGGRAWRPIRRRLREWLRAGLTLDQIKAHIDAGDHLPRPKL